jgi:CheY-like chemotaxis protein/HPt (histidine-containing phosphotransfer) domain-containing protein
VETANSKALIDEAETLLASIRGGVIVHVQDCLRPPHLRAPLEAARWLNACVERIGDDALRESYDALEAWLTLLAAESDPISHTRTRSLLDLISDVEVALISYKAASGSALDVADFVDETFDNLRLGQDEAPCPEADSNPDCETDKELLDVFREESAALLQNIQVNLGVLLSRPNDREALWEIKRSAHTFKGAAGILGLKRSSELAHMVEDLLDRLSEKDAAFDLEIFDLLVSVAKCLKRLSDGEDSEQLDARILILHRKFADTLRDLMKSGTELPATATVAPEAARDTEKGVQPGDATPLDSQTNRNKKIIRVSVERLDDLVRQVHQLVVSRPVVADQLDAFNQQLEESFNNTHRLQAASGRIQNFEAPPLETTNEAIWEHVRRLEFRQNTYELSETVRDSESIDTAMDDIRSNLGSLLGEQENLVAEIQKRLLRLRNVEFGTVANRLQRTVRVTCDEEGKSAEVVIENASLEIDTQTIDSLIEPLMHLLKNAVVHGIESAETRRMLAKPETGRITIRVDDDGAHVILTVTDDGGGISFQPLLEKAVASGLISRSEAEQMAPDDMHELVFLPGLTTAEKLSLNAGRGVGMSIVRESVGAINGTVSIETVPQRGTTFRLCVPHPFAQMTVPSELTAEPEPIPITGEWSALIVDDSPSVRAMTSRILKDAGWHAETAKNGIDALDRLRSRDVQPNVILSDLEMPKMGGHEFVAELRADDSLKDIPVVFITSKTDSSNMERALELGAAEYITKPYRERDLIDLLNRLAVDSPQLQAD